MDKINLVRKLPDMLMGEKLEQALQILPDYTENIRNENEAVRLIELSELYTVFIPNQMSKEIYSKLYLALLRSLQKKETQLAVQQLNENAKAVRGKEYSSILGGADSFTIIGASGIGKTSAISRAIDLMAGNEIIEIEEPYMKVIPCVLVQCPFDSSIKGMLLEILRVVDSKLDTKYYEKAVRARATLDMLIGSVSSVCLQHIGLLIVDEIQNVVNSKNGKNLIGSLTQLINNSGISIAMVGMPESRVFFEQAFQLARRSLGLYFNAMDYNEAFHQFCKTLFQFQYVKNKTQINDAIIHWFYEHSQGNISIVISLLHDAQEIAICDGRETLDMETLNDAYKKRLTLLHSFMSPKKKPQTARVKNACLDLQERTDIEIDEELSVTTLILRAKNECRDVVEFLSKYIIVERVVI